MSTLNWITSFLFSILRLSTPIIFAAMAAVICNKAGLLNMAIESMMLTAALAGVIFSAFTQSAIIGFVGAIVVGMIVAFVIAYASFVGKADLYLTNIAMNLAATGGTVFVLYAVCGEKSNSAGALNSLTLPSFNIPILKDIPILGPVLSGHNILTYLALIIPFIMFFFIYKTRLGLRIRSVGENPHAAQSVGISVTKIQFIAYTMSGGLAAIGGAFLSMGYLSAFNRNMTAGRGYIGLAASNMVNGHPIGAFFTSLLFGTSDAAAKALQMTNVITDFVLMIPYAVTIIGLVVISIFRQQKAKAAIRKAVEKKT